jgi:parvulin-like peptidyl-prolyl isomerase
MTYETFRPKPRRSFLAALASRRPERPLTLLVVGGVAGLAAAGFALFRPAEVVVRAVPPGYVAMVNDHGILMSDFIMQTEAETTGPFAEATKEQRQMVLQEMIDEELLVQRALALGLPELDTNARTALVDGVNSQVSAPVVARRVSDAELRAYYDANKDKYESQGFMRLNDIVLRFGGIEDADQSQDQAEADAAQAVYQLRSGASLDYVMQHFGFSKGALNGGEEFDFAAKIHLGPKLFAVASELSDGDISDPVTDKDGVHVLIMQHRQAPYLAEFDRVRNNVRGDFVEAEQKRVQQQNIQFLRANAEILITPEQAR